MKILHILDHSLPLRLARGVQNKALEAMSMGKAVVTTTKANEGIQAMSVVEDTPNGFSDAVSSVLKDRERKKQLGSRARKFVIENYNWATNMKKFDSIIRKS